MTDSSRRLVLGAAGVGIVAIGTYGWWRSRPQPQDPRWLAYKTRFLAPEGRIVDSGNGGISHSEGQGYGMLFAVAHDDRAVFDSLWQWTQKTLARPDGLHSWRYVPGATPPVADPNNASDGDLLMCWALLRAWRRWGRKDDEKAFRALAAVLKTVIVESGEKFYLLPGVAGFVDNTKRVVNLSYWIFPALRDLARETGDPMWNAVFETGVALADSAKFGDRHLPPDWLETFGTPHPADGFPPRFGYDAVRLPLNLVWAGVGTPERLKDIVAAWSSFGDKVPAWIDLTSDAVSPETQSVGMQTVAKLTAAAAEFHVADMAVVPSLDQASDYYSASLVMQCALALTDLAAASHAS